MGVIHMEMRARAVVVDAQVPLPIFVSCFFCPKTDFALKQKIVDDKEIKIVCLNLCWSTYCIYVWSGPAASAGDPASGAVMMPTPKARAHLAAAGPSVFEELDRIQEGLHEHLMKNPMDSHSNLPTIFGQVEPNAFDRNCFVDFSNHLRRCIFYGSIGTYWRWGALTHWKGLLGGVYSIENVFVFLSIFQ